MKCRLCYSDSMELIFDLGEMPLANAYLKNLDQKDPSYPLKIFLCKECLLLQTEDFNAPEDIFEEDYAYFSSTSLSWLNHAKSYVDMIVNRLSLNSDSFVLEIASNDGYLLRNFMERSIPCLGVEPTSSTASHARKNGINVIEDFFTLNMSEKEFMETKADLIVANNVIAHVPDITDFCKALKFALSDQGTITIEFPYLLNLVDGSQFDTIYHEHFSYFTVTSISKAFLNCGLSLFDLEYIPTHGGSVRLYLCHRNTFEAKDIVRKAFENEALRNIKTIDFYRKISEDADRIKEQLIGFLENNSEKRVFGYGAAAKANTLLNYCGISNEKVLGVFDAALSKQGKFMPGSKIPILSVEEFQIYSPDIVLIFPWNIKEEIYSILKNRCYFDGDIYVLSPFLEKL